MEPQETAVPDEHLNIQDTHRPTNLDPPSQLELEISQMLRTNTKPTPKQETTVAHLTQALNRESTALADAVISKELQIRKGSPDPAALRLEIVLLNKRRDEVTILQNRYSALFAPIRSVPPEILGEIFRMCLPLKIYARRRCAPIVLTRVCKIWRDVAHSFPALWSNLSIKWDGNMDNLLHLAKTWFSFSGLTVSLRLTIDYAQGGDYITYKSETVHSGRHNFVVFEAPNFWNRIRHLALLDNEGGMLSKLLNFLKDSLTAVEHLSIFYKPDNDRYSTWLIKPSFSKLSKLVLGNYSPTQRYIYDGTLDSMMPWHHLSTLNLLQILINQHDWMRLIRKCHMSLQHGSFMVTTEEVPPSRRSRGQHVPTQLEDTTLTSIRSLTVYFEESGNCSLLAGISTPHLLTLVLGSLSGLSKLDTRVLANLRAHSLMTLKLTKVEIQSEELVSFLRTTPDLRSLVLDIPIEYGQLFHHLTFLERDSTADEIDSDILLPMLLQLSLYQWKAFKLRDLVFDVDSFVQMIIARWFQETKGTVQSRRRPLKKVSLRMSQVNPSLNEKRSMLEKACEEGLNLDIIVERKGYRIVRGGRYL